MRKLFRAAVAMLAVLPAPVWAAQSADGLAATFGVPAWQSDLALSPSGRMLAWRQRTGAGFEVMAYDLAAHAVRRTLPLGRSVTLGWLHWQSDGTLLLGVSDTEHLPYDLSSDINGLPLRMSRVLAVNVASGKVHVLLADRMMTPGFGGVNLTTSVQLLAWNIPRRHTVIMASEEWLGTRYRSGTGTLIHNALRDSGWVGALFSVDTRTGKDTPLAQGDAFTQQWIVDAAGNPVARSEWQAQERHYAIFADAGGDWRQIFQRTDGIRPVLLGLDAAQHSLLATLPGADGQRRLWAIPLDGSAPKLMLPAVTQPVTSVAFAQYGDEPTAVWVGGSDPHRIWLDTASQVRYESVAHAFSGREVRVLGRSQDGQEVLAEVQDPSAAPLYYLIDFTTHQAIIAGEEYPQLDHVALATARTVRYQTGHGSAIQAQLLVPSGGGKHLPLVVLPPGGPQGGDPEEFDWFAQYLAASGYAVLRPLIPMAFLPSAGGAMRWGGASQSYAADGVRELVSEGVADPRHVCIVGVGYGGYAALAGAAFSPGTYACAVSINGISDLPALLGDEHKVLGRHESQNPAWVAWRTHVGSRFDPKVTAESPVQAPQAVAAPVLLIHEANDSVVPVEQSVEMDRALRRAGKPVTFTKLDGGDHWLTDGATRTRVLQAVGGFLRKYLH